MKKYKSFGGEVKFQCSEETLSFLNDLQGIPLEKGGLELIKKVGGYDGIVTITDRDGKRHLCGMKIGKDNDTSVNFDELWELKEEGEK